jgi:uncharacterized protein YbbC (DUF1343 family)
MKFNTIIIILLLSISNISCQNATENQKVILGNEVLLNENLELLNGKRIGLVTNHTSLLPNNVHLVDTLLALGINVTKLFSPEHGIRGNISAGQLISSTSDEKTGLPLFSLYGNTKKPSPAMLKDIDILLYDIQDLGVRFYTYISTLYYVLQAASENNIPIIVLDRPNPLNGVDIAGPLLEIKFKSFIGISSIPVVYGMTVGELANYFIKYDRLDVDKKPGLTVIGMKGWKRNYNWHDLNLKWIPPSPNIPDFETAQAYPGTCFIEGTNVSEGRGTHHPFLTIGAPYINADDLIKELNAINISGVSLKSISFTPVEIEGKALNPKYKGINCNGIKISITDEAKFKPVKFGIILIYSLLQLYPQQFKFNEQHFDKLAGTDKLRLDLLSDKALSIIVDGWQQDLEIFNSKRKNILIY